MPPSTSGVAELFLRVVPQVMRNLAADVRRSELEIEPLYIHLLRVLSRGDVSLGELAELLAVSPPTMSKTISTLESRGWVRRTRSDQDGRIVLVGLTAAGQTILQQAQDFMLAHIAEALEPLSDEECAKLRSGLKILEEVFSRAPASAESARTP